MINPLEMANNSIWYHPQRGNCLCTANLCRFGVYEYERSADTHASAGIVTQTTHKPPQPQTHPPPPPPPHTHAHTTYSHSHIYTHVRVHVRAHAHAKHTHTHIHVHVHKVYEQHYDVLVRWLPSAKDFRCWQMLMLHFCTRPL